MANTIIVSAADISLYHVAARELGNPQQWFAIAALNGLTDPSLAGLTAPTSLTLPAADLSQTDGLPVLSA